VCMALMFDVEFHLIKKCLEFLGSELASIVIFQDLNIFSNFFSLQMFWIFEILKSKFLCSSKCKWRICVSNHLWKIQSILLYQKMES
jgi:hypothetical protein